ncbi:hypothetical protein FDC62_00520 [Clostridium botulinum]|uniref:hypothetical protein n=1 Tax=Clostridium botulinum TaxID=1491 RepID=UPI0004D9739D|nr:hypothetical protein [Clostridium botulinum]KEI00205.1 hypothetical protein Z952_01980 [Clostridium botulinum C/D str. BKT75002]KEI09363.1 hypothetical protein Z954_13170 [Clostridium botulinum C/D str. BKT2873]KGM94676.1 hypothetical protein Z956_06860 [Clostridium botulinum D str. CCUG 7971]KOC49414.1 hypothetical protein ADU88_06330 [Clostridium botulinum]MCD3351301.1 hypothetical protein [Clostridium botulinum D/C]
MNKTILSPPWYSLNKRLQCTIGNNPYVNVSNLIPVSEGVFKTNISINDLNMARSTRAILPTSYTFGSIILNLYIYYKSLLIPSEYGHVYTPTEVGNLFNTALIKNYFFKGIVFPPSDSYLNNYNSAPYQVVVLTKKAIVQFYNDDISDFYLNTNEIASQSFNSICIHEFYKNINVHFNTENDRCIQ